VSELVIYGASDDLIEIESSEFGAEEFNYYLVDEPSFVLAISDGSLLRGRHDEDGIWRFDFVVIGSSIVNIDPGQDDRRHSDKVTLRGDNLSWVVLGTQIAK